MTNLCYKVLTYLMFCDKLNPSSFCGNCEVENSQLACKGLAVSTYYKLRIDHQSYLMGFVVFRNS